MPTNITQEIWSDGNTCEVIATERIETKNTHGSGCTFSAAIVANLALGLDTYAATIAAKNFVTESLRHSLSIGKGSGPLGHWFELNQ